MMDIVNEKYFGYIASSYGITFLIFAGFVFWIMMQHRAHKRHLAKLEEQGITRRSDSKPIRSEKR